MDTLGPILQIVERLERRAAWCDEAVKRRTAAASTAVLAEREKQAAELVAGLPSLKALAGEWRLPT